MSELVVRIAGRADIASLVELRSRWNRDDVAIPPVDPGFVDAFTTWFDAEASHRTFWLAERAGSPVGMTNLMVFTRMPVADRAAGGWGYLGNMYVVPEERDAGVGSRLLAAVLAHADANRLERVVLHPTERSVPFYRRAGFGDAGELLLRPRAAELS